ncbi:right-handed parallel beta-helix repeat-containing protein [uncultured Phycicoccus sp.]|uniref:right-handed parallel beta-helix repeat-containing protein n=1 Tax=uncultured Phycicoccus sp. TaxID=661422 RepID=UPI002612B787|nr:right-handed parallel beta-helix repeat-containing protein [uncultured Phycicoccus sp.]
MVERCRRVGWAMLAAGAVALAGVGTTPAWADSAASPYLVERVGTTSTYTATPASGPVVTGTLKAVVETAADRLTAEGGGVVRFQAGTYDLGSTWWEFYDLDRVVFEGAGMGATVIRNDASAATDTEPFDMTASDNITIRDLTVHAGGPLRSTSDAIDFDGGDHVLIERVEVSGSRARGIIFDGKGSGSISHADDNVIRDCWIHDTPGDGIELLASSRNLIEGCRISNVGNYGIRIGKSSSVATQPNKPSDDNIIRNNVIDESGRDGIFVNSSNRNQILGNTVTNSSDVASSRDGIRVTSYDSRSCDATVVRANRATDTQPTKTQSYGLNIVSSLCHGTVVGSDNDFTGNKRGPLKDLGTGTVVEVGNQPPTVSAGPDVTTSVGAGAVLDGTVSDEGPAPLSVAWSRVSGPAGVVFDDPGATDTTARFTAAGSYVLRLTATDGAGASASDDVSVAVLAPGTTILDVRVATSADDGEERDTGKVSRSSTDLELVTDTAPQVVGTRFTGVTVPQGATVTSAWVQFTTDEVTTDPAALEVRVQLSGDAPAITGNALNLSNRLSTSTAPVAWSPAPWTSVGAAGADQRTPDLASALQQVVSRPDWASGNAVLVLVTGSGRRTAEAYDGLPAGAPLLHIAYTVP